MEKLKFYPNEPGVLNKAGRFALGTSLWWSPAFLMSVVDWGSLPIGVFYTSLVGAVAYPKTRKYVMEANSIFWNRFKRYMESVRVSRVLRDTYEGAGLVEREKVETREGKREYVVYPATEVKKDEMNYYVNVRMLPGQTKKMWEQKVDAVAQALGGRIVAAEIAEGWVKVMVNHAPFRADKVLYKKDKEPYLMLGMEPGRILKWNFNQYPHCLIVGLTGSGKSTFMRNLLIQFPRDWVVRILDGKRIEFSFMKHYGFDVGVGGEIFERYVDEARNEMLRRAKILEGKGLNEYTDDPEMKPYFLVVDEFIYLINEVPAKKGKNGGPSRRDEVWTKLQDISLRGRALGVFLILITQRPDSEFLPTVVRDNMTMKVMLGGSETALTMVFGKEKIKGLELIREKGMGYYMIADSEVRPFRFPWYSLEQFKMDLDVRRRGELFNFEEARKRKEAEAERGRQALGS